MPVLDAVAVSPSKRARTEAKPEEERPVLRFAKLSEHATTPTRGSAKAAGYDLYRLALLHIKTVFEKLTSVIDHIFLTEVATT